MKKLTIIGEQEEELKCDESDKDDHNNMPVEDMKDQQPYIDLAVKVPLRDGLDQDGDQESPDVHSPFQIDGTNGEADKAEIKRQKRHKSKQIKKILKERLNIDCLRMLGEESPDEDALQRGAAKG